MIIDPRCRPYEPFGGARDLFYCKAPEVLLDGPSGTGKSRALLEKVHLCLLKYRGARALILRKSRKSMTDSVLVTFEEKVLPVGDPIKAGASRPMRHAYRYPNGSELVVGGMDSADKIMSTEYDLIAVFESTELTEDDWEKLTTRLRNGVIPYQQIIADCNPSGPTHWLNQRCLTGQTHRILSRHEDNPSVTESYLDTLRALTGARRARLYEGKWAAQEGLVYEDFDAAVHVLDRMPKGWETWRRVRSVDFGFTNPFVCQWWALDPDGRMYLYREIYHTRRLVEDHARQIVALSAGEKITATVADHDAEDRATLERHGVRTQAAFKSIIVGIQAVSARLRPAGDGKPRLYVLSDALVEADPELMESKKPYATTQEFGEYLWPKGQDGKPDKEVPIDDNNHGMDAMRYAVAYVDGITKKPARVVRAYSPSGMRRTA
jgi:PBSX family phage terminase large subunit